MQKGVDGKTGRKEIDKNKKHTPKRNGLPKPLRRRGCERKRWDEKGGDVPGGIRNAGCLGYKRMKKYGLKVSVLFSKL